MRCNGQGCRVAASSRLRAPEQLAKTNHPDKGGDPEEFKLISKAYAVRRRARGLHLCAFHAPLVPCCL